MADPIRENVRFMDLSDRFAVSTAVVGSPATTAETIVCTVAIAQNLTVVAGVVLIARVSFTVGTSGVSANFRIRQTNTSGSILGATGAVTETAANLDTLGVLGYDTAPGNGQIYVATLTVASAAAGSAVSGATLIAIAV